MARARAAGGRPAGDPDGNFVSVKTHLFTNTPDTYRFVWIAQRLGLDRPSLLRMMLREHLWRYECRAGGDPDSPGSKPPRLQEARQRKRNEVKWQRLLLALDARTAHRLRALASRYELEITDIARTIIADALPWYEARCAGLESYAPADSPAYPEIELPADPYPGTKLKLTLEDVLAMKDRDWKATGGQHRLGNLNPGEGPVEPEPMANSLPTPTKRRGGAPR